jgi:hypothetical protein
VLAFGVSLADDGSASPDVPSMAETPPHTTVTLPLAGGFRFGEWTVVPAENLLRRGDRKVRLEPKVMRLLLALVAGSR